MSKISESVENLVKPIAESMGLEIVEVEYAKKPEGMNLTIFIDKPGGVFLADCETFHRAIDEPLDELDPTEGASYTLNVSSPGADRPLKTNRDFEKNINKEITVKLYAAVGGKKQYEGFLTAFDENTFTVATAGGTLIFEKKQAAMVQPLIRF